MGEEVSKTVSTVSDGTVTIAVEKYHDLLNKAAEKPPVRVVQKTQAMIAQDNKVFGGLLIGGGICISFFGAVLFALGKAQEKALEKEKSSERL